MVVINYSHPDCGLYLPKELLFPTLDFVPELFSSDPALIVQFYEYWRYYARTLCLHTFDSIGGQWR